MQQVITDDIEKEEKKIFNLMSGVGFEPTPTNVDWYPLRHSVKCDVRLCAVCCHQPIRHIDDNQQFVNHPNVKLN
mgnify:CR=1 FL=1